jgi:hypothetical protein
VSFGNPENGKTLVRLANCLIKKTNGNSAITAMHLFPSSQSHQYNLEAYENESFAPIFEESKSLNQKITTLFKITSDIESDITEVANKGEYDLLLIGIGQSIFEGSLLGKILGFTTRLINPDRLINQITGKESLFENSPFDERTRSIIAKSKVSVGVLIDKGFSKTDQICIPVISPTDNFLIMFAQKLINFSESQISFIDVNKNINKNFELKESIRAIEQIAPNHVSLMNEGKISPDFLKQQNLMLISAESWKYLIETKNNWLTNIPSTLIITDKE